MLEHLFKQRQSQNHVIYAFENHVLIYLIYLICFISQIALMFKHLESNPMWMLPRYLNLPPIRFIFLLLLWSSKPSSPHQDNIFPPKEIGNTGLHLSLGITNLRQFQVEVESFTYSSIFFPLTRQSVSSGPLENREMNIFVHVLLLWVGYILKYLMTIITSHNKYEGFFKDHLIQSTWGWWEK